MRRVHHLAVMAITATVALFSISARAQSDASFMKDAAHAGATEIEASKLAQARSRQADVKKFADTMVADHTRVADELSALAARKNVKLPEGPSAKQQTDLKTLAASDADKFDVRYASQFGVAAHKDTIRLFEDAASNAQDPDVKAWAQKTLPGLRHHLEMAQALRVDPKP